MIFEPLLAFFIDSFININVFLGEKEVPSEVVTAFLVTSMISSDGDREGERKV